MRRYRAGERARMRWRSQERRRQPRVEPGLPVKVCGEATGLLHDISRTGLCLLTDEPLPKEQIVRIQLVDDASGLSCPFRARVIWYRPGLPGRAGLEFVEMTPAQDAWLACRFVDWIAAGLGI
jgi:hypothetical protein